MHNSSVAQSDSLWPHESQHTCKINLNYPNLVYLESEVVIGRKEWWKRKKGEKDREKEGKRNKSIEEGKEKGEEFIIFLLEGCRHTLINLEITRIYKFWCFRYLNYKNEIICFFFIFFFPEIAIKYLVLLHLVIWASLLAQMVKNTPAMCEPGFSPWIGKIPWRRAWQSTPVFLPGEFPWTEEPGNLQTMGPQRVGHDWATKHI